MANRYSTDGRGFHPAWVIGGFHPADEGRADAVNHPVARLVDTPEVIMPDQAELMRVLYEQHAAVLWRYTVGLVGDRQRAEDIVQETLLRAWQHPKVLDQSTASARGWLFTVARNLAFDEHRSARSRREVRTDTPPERPSADATDRAVDSWVVAEALSRLSQDHREVIVRSYYGGHSTQQIAADLDIPEGTVKSRMHYGMRALRLAMQELGVTK